MNFDSFAKEANRKLGSAKVFGLALVAIILWAFSGPFLDFSNRWQLIANTGTTLVTFILGFIILHGQNIDHKEEIELIKKMAEEIHSKVHDDKGGG